MCADVRADSKIAAAAYYGSSTVQNRNLQSASRLSARNMWLMYTHDLGCLQHVVPYR